jgi:hypothetical protein
MVASSVRSTWNKRSSVWNLPLDHPIEVGRGKLATLGDVGTFILALPDALKVDQLWQYAAETVVEAIRSRDTAHVTRAVYMALILTGDESPADRAADEFELSINLTTAKVLGARPNYS